jgi:hypothetical protein
MENSGGWQPGMGTPGSAAERGDVLACSGAGAAWPHLRRRAARFLALATLTWLVGLAGLAALAVALLPHGGVLAVILGLLAVPVLLLALGTGVLFWAGRRAWRSGAWLELVPVAAGMPWLGRVVWALRALVVGRAFWRLGQRARRPRSYARAGGLSGTTR